MMDNRFQIMAMILMSIPWGQFAWGQETNETPKIYYNFRKDVYNPQLQRDVVNADFGNGQYPPSGSFGSLENLQHLVLSGPLCLDFHFRSSINLRSIKVIVLDSTDVTDLAVAKFKEKRPKVNIIRSQRLAIAQLRALKEKVDGPSLETRLNNDHPEMRKLFGDELFTELVAIRPSFVPGEEMEIWPACLNEDLKPLKYCPTLEVADLTWCRIDDAGAQYLKHLPNLRELHVIAEELSDDGIADLASIPKLELLRLNFKEAGYYHYPKRTKERFERLKKAHPHVRIESFDVN